MTEVQLFNFENHEVRSLLINSEPWFVGKDVAEILSYSNTRKALTDHVDDEDKMDGVTIRDSIGRNQKPVLINESGLYSLVLSSKLPSAKKFKRWVTSEVLPTLRKTGQYLLLFAYIVKAAKEGRFTNGFDDEGEEKEFVRILNKVYKCPDDAIEVFGPLGDVNTISDILEALDRLFEEDYVDGE